MAEKNEGKSQEAKITEPILRDCLAVERTILANERTLLSYARAALGLFLGGVSFIHFFKSDVMQVLGWIFLPLGLIAFGLGVLRYNKIKYLIAQAESYCPFSNKNR